MQRPRDVHDAEYYKGLFTSGLEQRYTREADESSDGDMLMRNLRLSAFAAAFLAVATALFLRSNGII